MSNYCADCGDALLPGKTSCPCGWKDKSKDQANVPRFCACGAKVEHIDQCWKCYESDNRGRWDRELAETLKGVSKAAEG